jgi:hypothetical protein
VLPQFRVIPLLLVAIPVTAQNFPVTQNQRSAWARGQEWRVAAQPYVDIGKAEGEPEYELSAVMGVTRLSDGRIVIGNMQSGELRIYDARGKFLKAAGRKGRGPGEFSQIMGMHWLRGDSIAVIDGMAVLEIFSPDGTWSRSGPTSPTPSMTLQGVFADGSVVAADWPQRRRGNTERYTDSTNVEIVRPDGSRLRLGRFAASVFVPGDISNLRWGPRFGIGVGPATLYIGFSDKWELRQFNTQGQPIRTIRRNWTPAPITEEDTRVYNERYINAPGEGGGQISEQFKQRRRQQVETSESAKVLPAFSHLLVDRVGNLWVREPIPPRHEPMNSRFHETGDFEQHWSVIDPQGRWLGQVSTPRNFQVMEIGNDYIAGLFRDELDVEHVRLYRLEKPR